jgi:HPt (histidine-containing phosphotransfer) domain-containing protein
MDSSGEPEAGQAALKEALDRMWIKFLPQIKERVAVLEAAAAAFAANRLSAEEWAAAHGAAHKLAGTLGTFGLDEGTILAREAEVLYADTCGHDPVSAARLIEIASRLRTIIESRM